MLLFSGQDSRRQVLLTYPGDRRRFDGNPIRFPLRMLTNLERMTGIEPATCTLARCRATNCATSTSETHAFRRGAPSLARHGAAVERPLHGRRGAGTDGSAFRSRSGWSPTTVEPPSGVEPEASFLPRTRSATELWRRCTTGAGEPQAGFEPATDTAYKAAALAGLSYQGVVVALPEWGHSVERAPGAPPAKTAVTRAINSAQWPFASLPRLDSNQKPTGPEPVATTNCATGQKRFQSADLLPRQGSNLNSRSQNPVGCRLPHKALFIRTR